MGIPECWAYALIKYRSVFETMDIDDPDGISAKGFNSLEISCKTKTQINDES